MGTSCLIPPIPSRSTKGGGVGWRIKAMMWMDDVYHDFARQDVINPPLDYQYNDIQRLDFGGSTI